jgi:hypothetical protein
MSFLSNFLCKVFGIGCPQPIPPPQSIVHSTGVVAVDDKGAPIEGATCSVGPQSGPTNKDGYVLFNNVPVGSQVASCSKEGYNGGSSSYVNDHDQNVTVMLQPNTPPPVTHLPPLTIAGKYFKSGGANFTVVQSSDFALLYNVLNGIDVSPVLAQRRDAGFNMVRIFLMARNLFDLNPAAHSSYFATLSQLPGLLAQFGLYGEYVVFADATQVMPNLDDQKNFVIQVNDALSPWADNCLLELVNENDQPVNTIDTNSFPQPNALSSHGSNGSQMWPVNGTWAYETFHTNDAPEWWRKTGHNAMEVADAHNVPVITNENTRYPDRDSSTAHAYDAAAGAALLCAGSCFHSIHGRSSELWDVIELAAAQQWAAGAQSVNLAYQIGSYRHRTDLEGPGILRAYDRVLSDGTSFVVTIRS